MAQSHTKLILHPVRFRIIRALSGDSLSTQQIASAMPDVPKSTIYHHLRLLLNAEILQVADTRTINGIQEKFYSLTPDNMHNLSPEEFASLSKQEHIDYLNLFAMSMMQDFAAALEPVPDENLDTASLGYREYTFYATDEEFADIRQMIYQRLRQAEKENAPTSARKKYKFSIVTYETPKQDAD